MNGDMSLFNPLKLRSKKENRKETNKRTNVSHEKENQTRKVIMIETPVRREGLILFESAASPK